MPSQNDSVLRLFLTPYFKRKNSNTSSHEFHVEIAWSLLNKFETNLAFRLAAIGYRIFAKPGGKFGYHATITMAYMLLISGRMLEKKHDSFLGFKSANPNLFEGGFKVLNQYYSEQLLWSNESRETFIDGDLCKLPNPLNIELFI